MRIDIMTLFPEMCEAFLSESIIGRARRAGKVEIGCHNIRDYTEDKHNRVDDYPYGGGTGMIMQAQPIYDCYQAVRTLSEAPAHLVYLSPCGQTLNQDKVRELAEEEHLVMLCGHYEGVDQRVLDEIVDEEISIGDYVLTGGELPACVLADSICRMLPGVLANEDAYTLESHYSHLLEHPQYTRPPEWRGRAVPPVLLSGDHGKVDRWKLEESVRRTWERRPDMLRSASLTPEETEILRNLERKEGKLTGQQT
ncbi:MAG: tRNA (guanosine(37)-N1)-methyltransferase TrmD [Oscillospiraceae bacterium]|nr:tRNA (guanosine(37)-N1)-methyltransferase TrmD [Oscillospiraceae bacterium]